MKICCCHKINLAEICYVNIISPICFTSTSSKKNGDDESFIEQHLKNPRTSKDSSVEQELSIFVSVEFYLVRSPFRSLLFYVYGSYCKYIAFQSDSNALPDPFYLQDRRGMLPILEYYKVLMIMETQLHNIFLHTLTDTEIVKTEQKFYESYLLPSSNLQPSAN